MGDKNKKLTTVSLFAGAGGLEIAACSTSLVGRLFSTDSNQVFLQTVIDNITTHFSGIKHSHLVIDARELTGSMIGEALGTNEIDLVMGGPPCDDFTTFGRKRGTTGEKAPLIMEFSRLISELRPKAFLFENVPNLTRQFNRFFVDFLDSFPKAYGTIKWEILSAMNYGAPTLRKRVFAVGFMGEKPRERFQFPTPIRGAANGQRSLFVNDTDLDPYTTVGDVLTDLPDVTDTRGGRHLNHTGRQHRKATVEHIKTVPQGVAVKKSYRYRAPWDGLCRSLTAGVDYSTKSYIHPIYHREMSVREYARIHGFPDSWLFNGNHHNGIKQVANAVPVLLGLAIINSIIQAIRGL